MFLLIALVAAVPRLLVVSAATSDDIFAMPDAEGYSNLALNMMRGHGFSMDTEPPYRPDSLRTPLYPMFIAGAYAAFGVSPKGVVVAQALLDVVTALLVAGMAMRLAGTMAAVSAGFIYALTPSQWLYAGQLLTESLLALLIAAALCCLIVVRHPYLLGLSLGALGALCLYCKPNAIPLALLFALAAGFRSRSLIRLPAVVLATTVALTLPWVARNAFVFGRPMISTVFENNIAHVSAVATLNEVEHSSALPWDDKWEEIYTSILASTEARYNFQFFTDRTWSPREEDLHWQQVTWQSEAIIKAHPVEAVLAHLSGTVSVWWRAEEYRSWYSWLTGTDWPWPEVLKSVVMQDVKQGHIATGATRLADGLRAMPASAIAFWIGWHAVYLVGTLALLAGAWFLRRDPVILLTVIGVVAYLTLLPGPIGYERFRVPFVPLLATLEGIGLAAIASWNAARNPLARSR